MATIQVRACLIERMCGQLVRAGNTRRRCSLLTLNSDIFHFISHNKLCSLCFFLFVLVFSLLFPLFSFRASLFFLCFFCVSALFFLCVFSLFYIFFCASGMVCIWNLFGVSIGAVVKCTKVAVIPRR